MKKILVIEDNAVNMKLTRNILKLMNLAIMEATNGAEALKLLEQQLPDLILTDIQLPDVNGIDLIKTIKSTETFSHIPVIALSAYASDQDIECGMEAGCIDYITKPINIKVFMEKIKHQISI